MSLERESIPEKNEEVILKVIVFRHGPKLSAAGEKNAKAAYFDDSVKRGFGAMNMKEGAGLARVATSSVQRAVDTANITQNEIKTTDHRTKDYVKRDKALEVPFQPPKDAKEKRYATDLDRIVSLQKEMQPIIVEEIENDHPELAGEAKEAEVRNRIDMAVLSEMFDEVANPLPARIFETKYDELASIFSGRYLGFASHMDFLEDTKKLGGKQPQSEPYLQIDVTHSFPVMAFLKKYFIFEDGENAESMNSSDFFERTGGIIRESGSFEMNFINSDPPKIKVEGEFEPGKKFEGFIDLNKMKKDDKEKQKN